MRWSVVVAVLNEEAGIADALRALRATPGGRAAQVIVVDGGSSDRTVELAAEHADKVIEAQKRGRGFQQYRGALEAVGDALLFLHADARLPADWAEAAQAALRDPTVAATAFSIDYGVPRWNYRCLERLVHWRARNFGVVYGDHGLAVTRALYDAVGGVPAVPIMEDVDFAARLRRRGELRLLPQRIRVSNRRQEGRSLLLSALRNFGLICLYKAGVPPERIWQMYYNRV